MAAQRRRQQKREKMPTSSSATAAGVFSLSLAALASASLRRIASLRSSASERVAITLVIQLWHAMHRPRAREYARVSICAPSGGAKLSQADSTDGRFPVTTRLYGRECTGGSQRDRAQLRAAMMEGAESSRLVSFLCNKTSCKPSMSPIACGHLRHVATGRSGDDRMSFSALRLARCCKSRFFGGIDLDAAIVSVAITSIARKPIVPHGQSAVRHSCSRARFFLAGRAQC